MRHLKKKASLELSINAIVILILAITMLGLGLGFMRNIFGGATDQFKEMTGTVQKQMIDQMKESGQIVEINRPKITVKAGDGDQIFIGFRNVQQDALAFNFDNAECTMIGDSTDCDGISLAYKTTETTVESGRVTVLPVNIVTESDVDAGTYFFNIEVLAGDQTERVELTVDITV